VGTADPLVVAQIAVATAQDVLFVLAAGALVCGAMLRRQDPGRLAALGRTRLGALCVLALACVLYLWLEAAVMSGSPFSEAGPAVSAVLTQSHFGIAWSVGFAGVVVACFGGTRDSRAEWWLAAAGMVV
jgi:putative copper resistance protein D